jgi:energy-coupling factor transporter ATP-binding protein EcfA2
MSISASKSSMNIQRQNEITIDIPTNIERTNFVSLPFPSRNQFLRFGAWAVGRVSLGSVRLTIYLTKSALCGTVHLLDILDKGMQGLETYYDLLPAMGMPMQSFTARLASQMSDVLPALDTCNLMESIAGKHCLIIGDTGTGKSTIAQYIAMQSASAIKVYDPDASPDDWQGLEVVGRGGDFASIENAMIADLDEMEERIKARAVSGDTATTGKDICIIAEEFPLLTDECDLAATWLGKIARRGRKPKMFIVALSQSDSVQALGIEGDGAVRSNFTYIRLGKFALAHAKHLKNDALRQWLQAGKYRCLIDDTPCQLPDMNVYRPLPQLSLFSPFTQAPLTPEVPTVQDSQPLPRTVEAGNQHLKTAVQALKSAGWSDSKIITEVLGMGGRRFGEGKVLLGQLLEGKDKAA